MVAAEAGVSRIQKASASFNNSIVTIEETMFWKEITNK